MKTTLLFLLCISNAWAQIGAKTQQNNLVGTWHNNDFGYTMTLLLNANSTGEFDGEQVQYKVSGSMLTITQADISTKYTYELSGGKLILSGGDLESPISFNRAGSSSATVKNTVSTAGSTSKNLIGIWSGYGEVVEFKADGSCMYAGQRFPCTISDEQIFLQSANGQVPISYKVAGDQLSLIVNGQTFVYKKGNEVATTSKTVPADARGTELEGKWCYVNVTSSYSGGSSAEQCITLHANGTYEYYEESSRSVSGSSFYGGTNAQGSDRGTWKYDGQRVYYQSQTGKGSGSYLLEKRNHPKTNDPMIVLDGTCYVTQFQRSPWN